MSTNKKIIVAVDPGASGAMAVRYPEGQIVAFPWRGEAEFKDSIKELASLRQVDNFEFIAVVEKVGGFTGANQPGSAMFNFGRNTGYILGCLDMADFSIREVRPQVWQKGLPQTPKLASRAASQAQHKRDLKEVAAKLFPQIKTTLKNADALLILDYAVRNYLRA